MCGYTIYNLYRNATSTAHAEPLKPLRNVPQDGTPWSQKKINKSAVVSGHTVACTDNIIHKYILIPNIGAKCWWEPFCGYIRGLAFFRAFLTLVGCLHPLSVLLNGDEVAYLQYLIISYHIAWNGNIFIQILTHTEFRYALRLTTK